MSKTVTRLSIDRSKWGMGRLLDPTTGKKCCLGHLATACGVPDHAMGHEFRFMPSDLPRGELYKYPPKFMDTRIDFGVAQLASSINDNEDMRRSEREYRLKILFRAHGIKLTFRGRP